MPLLSFHSSKSPQPNKITTPLKPHQLALIKACEDFEIENQNKTCYESSFDVGLIGDRVGAGKSLVALGIIGNNQPITPPDHFKYKIRECSGYRHVTPINNSDIKCQVDINMIIVPHPTFGQWKSYIKNDTNMKVLYINGLKELKLMDKDIPPIVYDTNNINDMVKDFFKPYDLVCISSLRIKELTQYNMNICNYFEYVSFNRIFIDECDSIQIKNGFKFSATFYWMISSSYHNIKIYRPSYSYANTNPNITDLRKSYDSHTGYMIQKRVGGLTTQNEFIKKKLEFCALFNNNNTVFDKFHFRNTNEFIDKSFKMNEPNIIKIICKNPLFMKIVGDVLSNSIINRINAGDMNGALNLFKCEKTNDENIIQTVCRDLNERLGANNLKITKAAEKTAITTLEVDQKHSLLQKLNTKSNELKEKIKNIQDKIKSNNLCCICYDEPETKMMTMCCNSLYCIECITHWMKNNIITPTCPFCRNTITNKSLLAVDNSYKKEVVKSSSSNLKDKMENFTDLMDKLTNDPVKTHKILVFSDFVAIFDELEVYFKDNNIKFTKISGSSKIIENKIINYKSNVVDVLLLNSKTCGSGLNLENTTDIIIYHQVNKDLQAQIIGRALRPGHEGELNVHKLLNESENE